jgi:hypothetical protein
MEMVDCKGGKNLKPLNTKHITPHYVLLTHYSRLTTHRFNMNAND